MLTFNIFVYGLVRSYLLVIIPFDLLLSLILVLSQLITLLDSLIIYYFIIFNNQDGQEEGHSVLIITFLDSPRALDLGNLSGKLCSWYQ